MERSMQPRCDCRVTRASATADAAVTSNDAEAPAAAAAAAKAAEHGGEKQRGANGNVKRKGCAAKRSAAIRPRGGEVAAERRHRREETSLDSERKQIYKKGEKKLRRNELRSMRSLLTPLLFAPAPTSCEDFVAQT
jgi:hypothetical protein